MGEKKSDETAKGSVSEKENVNKENTNKETSNKETTKLDNSSDFEFLKEKIKERPVNKKKLLQRTIITASMALVFGGVACLTFLLMEPVLNNWLYPEEKPAEVNFPQEKQEMLPEDMLTEGNTTNIDMTEEIPESSEVLTQPQTEIEISSIETTETSTDENGTEADTSETSSENAVEESLVDDMEIAVPIMNYQAQYDELYKLYQNVAPSIVTVTAVKSDINWFSDRLQSEGTGAGVIIANNNRELLILTKKSPLDKADSISVTFCDGVSVDAVIKKFDVSTDLAVIAVDLKYVGGTTMDHVAVAKLGSSLTSAQTGSLIVAVGNILGYSDTVSYGMITSKGNAIYVSDSEYNLITTDIYSSEKPSGILIDLNGEVIGIIDNSFNNADTKNLMAAIGITELKGLITKLSNGDDIPYLGIQAQSVAANIRKKLEIPQGAYIFDIDMDSPAMINGLQKGDIIVRMGAQEIRNASDYMNALRSSSTENEISITIMRAAVDEYKEMKFNIQPQIRIKK